MAYAIGEASAPLLYGWNGGGVAELQTTVENIEIGTPDDLPNSGQLPGDRTVRPVSAHLSIANSSGEDVPAGDLSSLVRANFMNIEGSMIAEQPEELGFTTETG